MSIYSDYKCGALSDEQFENECRRENRRERINRERKVNRSWKKVMDWLAKDVKDEWEDDDSEGGLIADD